MMIPEWEMLLRMGAAAVLGAGIGYERERGGRPAGLRTHLLVSLASATFMLVATHFVYFQSYGKDDLVMVDTSRIAASEVAGVGFLGAGAILRTGLGVQGLTTAASSGSSLTSGLPPVAGCTGKPWRRRG
jgi:putative Mg2+ transporter-C (MgtC) family protein